MNFTRELKVGILALVALFVSGALILFTNERPDRFGDAQPYVLRARFENASGVYVATQVRIAGVPIGNVIGIQLDGREAVLTLDIGSGQRLPVDSRVELVADGFLGDKQLVVITGVSSEYLEDGDEISGVMGGPDIEKWTLQAEALAGDLKQISSDLAVITTSVRGFVESDTQMSRLDTTLENVRQLSEDLRELTRRTGEEVEAVVQSLAEISDSVNKVLKSTGGRVDTELAAIESATLKLDSALTSVQSIAAKIDAGEGTLGELVNDDAAADSLRTALDATVDAVAEVQTVLDTIVKLETRVDYDAHYFVGTEPTRGSLSANPMVNSYRQVVRVDIVPPERQGFYTAEIVDHPLGTLRYEQHFYPDVGDGSTGYTEYVRASDLRYTFMLARKWGPLIGRFGMKESSGGAGLDLVAWEDRFRLSADVFDFTFGSWPLIEGPPNLQLTARIEPWRFLHLTAGAHNVLLGAQNGFVTGYVGGGVQFTDQDLKWVLSALPLP